MEGYCASNSEAYMKTENALTLRLKELLEHRLAINTFEKQLLSAIHHSSKELDNRQRVHLPSVSGSLMIFHENMQKISRSFMEDTKHDLFNLFIGQDFTVWTIRDVALMFLYAFRNNHASLVDINSQVYDWLNDDFVLILAHIATAMYLEMWLSEDRTNYQTPYGFIAHPYKIEDSCQKGRSQPLDTEEKAIQRAYKHYEKFFELKNWQSIKEWTPPLNKQYSDDDRGRPVDLITLAWCEAKIADSLDILDYLYKKKDFMTRAEDMRSGKERGLSEACIRYQQYICDINKINIDGTSPIENYRKFVASSMMLHKLERACHFHLFGRVAERICDKSIDSEKYSSNIAGELLGRFEGNQGNLFMPSWAAENVSAAQTKELPGYPKCTKPAKKPYRYVNEHNDILNNDYYINQIFCVNGEETSNIEMQLHRYRRILMQDLLVFLFALYPPYEQHTWKEIDFHNAALFYRNYYPITEVLSKGFFPTIQSTRKSNKKDFYYYFRLIYQTLLLDENGPLPQGREYYKKDTTHDPDTPSDKS